MKIVLKLSVFALILLLNSCSYIERDFIARWRVTDVELDSPYRKNMITDEQRRYFSMIEYEFMEDGKMIYAENGDEVEGSWKLVRGEYIEMSYRYSNYWRTMAGELSYKIISCTRGKLVMSVKFVENETWIFYLEEVEN